MSLPGRQAVRKRLIVVAGQENHAANRLERSAMKWRGVMGVLLKNR